MERTRDTLVELIWSRVQDGETIHDAAVAVHAEIAASPTELAAWWSALGLYWLKFSERDNRRLGTQPLTIAEPGWTPPANFGTSWRDRVTDPLNILVSVGTTGVQKPAGDLTREEVAINADMYRAYAEAHATRQHQWLSIHNAMKDGETIRDAAKRRKSLLKGDLPWVKRSQKDEPAPVAA